MKLWILNIRNRQVYRRPTFLESIYWLLTDPIFRRHLHLSLLLFKLVCVISIEHGRWISVLYLVGTPVYEVSSHYSLIRAIIPGILILLDGIWDLQGWTQCLLERWSCHIHCGLWWPVSHSSSTRFIKWGRLLVNLNWSWHLTKIIKCFVFVRGVEFGHC